MKPLSVYIAAPSQMLDEARVLADLLFHSGIGCTSSWIVNGLSGDCDASASRDLNDVVIADALVAINPRAWANKGTGGRHVEFGYAIAIQKPIVVLGSRTNVFHYLDSVRCVSTVVDLVGVLTEMRLPLSETAV